MLVAQLADFKKLYVLIAEIKIKCSRRHIQGGKRTGEHEGGGGDDRKEGNVGGVIPLFLGMPNQKHFCTKNSAARIGETLTV